MDIDSIFFNTNDFKLQETVLGEGSFGTVYISQNVHDKKLYAIKIFDKENNFNGKQQMLFMRESLILHGLKHPAIIGFKGVNFQSFEDPSILEPSIITEYMKKGSLKNILNLEKQSLCNMGWSSTKKYIILLGITSAMKYLHKHGIIHRDLKPENILLDDDYRPHICDFGLSRCFPKSLSKSMKLTMTGQIGTPLYMAPELLLNDNHYSSSLDVYSFSMVAYEIITGKEPFSESGEIPVIPMWVKILNGHRPELPSFVPEKMRNLLSRCWDTEPEKRPSFEEIFNELSNDFTYI